MCHYGDSLCAGPDREHECRPDPARVARSNYDPPPSLQELEERVAYAEASIGVYCSEFLAAREGERDARQKSLDAACRWGRAWRELASARKALSRERESLAMLARVLGRSEAEA